MRSAADAQDLAGDEVGVVEREVQHSKPVTRHDVGDTSATAGKKSEK